MRHACVTIALVFTLADMHAACVDTYEWMYDRRDSDQDRRVARLLLDADRAYARTPCSVDSIMLVYDAQAQLELALQPRGPL